MGAIQEQRSCAASLPRAIGTRKTPLGRTGDTTAPSTFRTPPLPRTPAQPGPKERDGDGVEVPYRDHDRVFALKLGDVFIAAVHFRLVERSEATHHFDVALGRVRHLSRCRGRRTGATPRHSSLGGSRPRAEGIGSQRQRESAVRRVALLLAAAAGKPGLQEREPAAVALGLTSDSSWQPWRRRHRVERPRLLGF